MNARMWLGIVLLLAACTPEETQHVRDTVCIPTRSCDCKACEGMTIK